MRAASLSGIDPGTLSHRGYAHQGPSALELAHGGRMMELARWPNRGAHEALDAFSDATVTGDIFGAGTTFSALGTTAMGGADDGFPNYTANVGGSDYFLYHCTWGDGGGNRYWFISTHDPRSDPSCWPTDTTSWLGHGTRPDYLPLLEAFNGGSSETVVARQHAIDAPYHGLLRIPEDPSGNRFRFPGDRYSAWSGEDLLAQGLFGKDWADDTVPMTIDGAGMVTLAEDVAYGVNRGQPFFVLNALAELDAPGEYYVDRDNGQLFFWPVGPLDGGDVEVSILEEAILRMRDVSYVELHGIGFELGRETLVDATGLEGVLFSHCTFKNGGRGGVVLEGHASGIAHGELYGLGAMAISIAGGDRPSLTAGEVFVRDSHIHDYARWERTYREAVRIAGSGNVVEHNEIHDAPHFAIRFSGNEHVIRANDIHDVTRESNDAAAIYPGATGAIAARSSSRTSSTRSRASSAARTRSTSTTPRAGSPRARTSSTTCRGSAC